jgi:hypothetical protein
MTNLGKPSEMDQSDQRNHITAKKERMDGNPRRPKSSEMRGKEHAYPAQQSQLKRQPISDLSDYKAAAGPIWTPNIPSTMPIWEIDDFGYKTALKRSGQPEEAAPVYVTLAASDSSYMTGSQIEVTGSVMSSR